MPSPFERRPAQERKSPGIVVYHPKKHRRSETLEHMDYDGMSRCPRWLPTAHSARSTSRTPPRAMNGSPLERWESKIGTAVVGGRSTGSQFRLNGRGMPVLAS